jgi:uncharacterized protein (TIGR03435 family)
MTLTTLSPRLVCATALVLASPALFAHDSFALRRSRVSQEPAPAAFEVATVKPSDTNSPPTSIERKGNRLLSTNTSLAFLVKWAFELDDERLIGMPGGADRVHFDVVGKAPEETPAPGRMQAMMRTLLAERFRFQSHSEQRRLTTYALILDGTPKVRTSTSTGPPSSSPFTMAGAGRLSGTRVTTAMLAKVLSSQLGRPVQDLTGVDGVFDFTLEWAPDSAAPGDSSRPSIFTALREQLGMRLESRQLAVDVLVVDRVELSPTAD